MRKCDEGRQQGESSGEKKNNEELSAGAGVGAKKATTRTCGGGRISERYSSCLHSLPPSLPSSFIHSFNLVSTRCRVTDDMDGRAGDSQVDDNFGAMYVKVA